MKLKILFIFLLSFQFFSSQNHDFIKLKKYEKSILSDTLNESSGLVILQDKLFTFNDSGNPPYIYEINPDEGSIIKTYKTNAENYDWEAMTTSQNDFYVGDSGNNLGNRKNLCIYRIPYYKDSLTLSIEKKIDFYYPEQGDYSGRNRKHDFDAEAMVFSDETIHLFTKEWMSKYVTHYTIDPNANTKQAAKKIERFNIGYLVTDAVLYKDHLYFVGYSKKGEIYLTSFFINKNSQLFFSGENKTYFLGMTSRFGQIEGITANDEGLYISGENFKYKFINAKPRLFFIPFSQMK